MITVINKNDYSDRGERNNHRNQQRNHRNQFIKKTRGQSIAEYAILISVVTAALLAMQIYMKRGIQAVVKYSTDQWGNQEWMETDPERGVLQNSFFHSLSDGESRIQQEGTDVSFTSTYITNETSSTTGVSVYRSEEQL